MEHSHFQVTSVSKKLGQSPIVYYYCALSRFFETDVNWSTVGWHYKLCLSRHCLLFLYLTFILTFFTGGALHNYGVFLNIQNFTCTIWNSRETFIMICHLNQKRSYEAGWSVLELHTRGAVHFLLNIKLCGETLSIKNMNMTFFEITF